jgi:hypothetical protein
MKWWKAYENINDIKWPPHGSTPNEISPISAMKRCELVCFLWKLFDNEDYENYWE